MGADHIRVRSMSCMDGWRSPSAPPPPFCLRRRGAEAEPTVGYQPRTHARIIPSLIMHAAVGVSASAASSDQGPLHGGRGPVADLGLKLRVCHVGIRYNLKKFGAQ